MREEKVWKHHYVLIDPRIEDPIKQVFYVGRAAGGTRTPRKRLYDHLDQSKRGRKSHKCNKIRKMLTEGCKPQMIVLQDCAEYEDFEAELIANYRENGAPLTNHADGGGGATGYHPDNSIRARISAGNKISQSTLEARAKKSAVSIATWADPITREKRIEALRLAFSRPDVKAKHTEANRLAWAKPGRRAKHAEIMSSPEVRQKMRDALADPEVRRYRQEKAAIANARPEVKARRSEATRMSWEDPEIKEKRSQAIVQAWENPDTRAKHSISACAAAAAKQGLTLEQFDERDRMVIRLHDAGVSKEQISNTLSITITQVTKAIYREDKKKPVEKQNVIDARVGL